MLEFPVAILAGGMATRLRPLSDAVPKILVPVQGEPLLAHQLRLLKLQGCRKVILCVGRMAGMVEEFAKDGREFGLQVEYSHDGERLMGTAGALRRALPRIDARACFVLYGDSYLPCDYSDVERSFAAQGKPALMTIFRNEGAWDSSNVEFRAGALCRYSKTLKTPEMRYIDYGLGILSRPVIERIPDDRPSDLGALYETLVENGEMAAYEAKQRFYEAGSFEGIADLAEFLGTRAER